MAWPRGRELVHAVRAVDDPGALAAEIAEHMGEWLDPALGEHADKLAARARGIGERPQQVEDRARAELDPRAGDMAHRAVMPGRHEEADAGLLQRLRNERHVAVDIDAERRQHVGGAGLRGQRPVAVLDHGHACAGQQQRGGGGDVERALVVAARAGGVDRIGRRFDPQHLLAHDPRRAGDLVDGLAAHAQRHQEGARLGGRGVSRHQDLESGLGLRLPKLRAVRHARQDGSQIAAHAANTRRSGSGFGAPAGGRPDTEVRKLASSRWPCSEAMLSGWNCTP